MNSCFLTTIPFWLIGHNFVFWYLVLFFALGYLWARSHFDGLDGIIAEKTMLAYVIICIGSNGSVHSVPSLLDIHPNYWYSALSQVTTRSILQKSNSVRNLWSWVTRECVHTVSVSVPFDYYDAHQLIHFPHTWLSNNAVDFTILEESRCFYWCKMKDFFLAVLSVITSLILLLLFIVIGKLWSILFCGEFMNSPSEFCTKVKKNTQFQCIDKDSITTCCII